MTNEKMLSQEDILNLNKRQISENYIKKHHPVFYDFLNKKYGDICFDEKIYLYKNGLDKPGVCKVCGKPTKLINKTIGYRTYCSHKCNNSDPDKIQKQKCTFEAKYGVSNPSKLDYIKEKKKNTCASHFDGGYSSKILRDKAKKTTLEKYGNSNYRNTEKASQTFLKKYGVNHPSKCPEVMAKKRSTNLKHFGVEWTCQLEQARNYSNNSKPNLVFKKKLEENNISFEREFSLGSYSFDFKIENLLIEIDPTGTHNSNFGLFGGQPKSRHYHLNKTRYAELNGFRCIHVWDWDDLEKIMTIIKNESEVIYARNCDVKEISKKECDEFLRENHLQGTCRGQMIRLGLYCDNSLVQVMTFGKPRYNKKFEYELLRLCSVKKIVGGSEKLFNYFKKHYDPSTIVSYCDYSKFGGGVYEILGFNLYRDSTPSRHWYKNGIHVTDNLLRQRGFDQLFKTSFGNGTSNEQLMIDHHFLSIWDCGQKTYAWTKKEEPV